ncbi:LysM peptidoglycan-binding domain-containing protein [Oleiagrimonas sp. C23AA]|uniref:LysM peptidoglycan-binding domain-containing protein n=1 Tax=Oleiagrimonas sp. C23AA TaxID=2719047 RepID=UPI0014216808|nr:LysM peptidoglycan-binding domain-containing protein [Oleiagrimonas sp. C23AA]NII10288.1 transglycosylase SLT domain-containing protein [Oleiagrimonas sp. C23AA]
MRWRTVYVVAASAALSACASLPGTHAPAHKPTVKAPPPVAPALTGAPPALLKPPPLPEDFWGDLRSRLALDDCDGDPAILRRAQRITHNRRGFEAKLRWAMPTLAYIDEAAARHGVAGEFVLLPWIESHFDGVKPRRGRAAGMWQIMPITGRSLGLAMDQDYDGRLDRISATDAVMKMLRSYYDRWHDWRIVDMAYNAGEYRLRGLIKQHGMPPRHPVIPSMVSPGVHRHLVKLLAVACVIRQPARFGITLPDLPPPQRLQEVTLKQALSLKLVARLAQLPLSEVRQLNPAYIHDRMPAHAPRHLLLPAAAKTTLLATLASHPPSEAEIAKANRPDSYTVHSGDSLWMVAHKFHVSVHQLKRWNHLKGSTLHPGQTLSVSAP